MYVHRKNVRGTQSTRGTAVTAASLIVTSHRRTPIVATGGVPRRTSASSRWLLRLIPMAGDQEDDQKAEVSLEAIQVSDLSSCRPLPLPPPPPPPATAVLVRPHPGLPFCLQDATAKITEAAEALERRQQLREANLTPARPGVLHACRAAHPAVPPPLLPVHSTAVTPSLPPVLKPSAAEPELKKLDSSMKRNQAVIRKLRTALSEESRASLLQDIEKTNQSKVCVCGGGGARCGGQVCDRV